jgi:hypothetical protein
MMLGALLSEVWEVLEAVVKCRPIEVIEELCDVWHATVCMISILVFGTWTQSQFIYYFIYMITPLTAWKHGDRQRQWGCIRSLNHHKNALNHVCCGDAKKIQMAFKSSLTF